MPETLDLESMGGNPMAPVVIRLRRLAYLLEAHESAEEFAGHAVRTLGKEALDTVWSVFECTRTDLRLIALLVALEAKEKSLTNPKKDI